MSSPFVENMLRDAGSKYPKQYGKKGAVEYTMHGVKSENHRDVEGYLTAAFSGILRGVSEEMVKQYVENVFKSRARLE